jgi:L-Ala-D/L-Glu epimerase
VSALALELVGVHARLPRPAANARSSLIERRGVMLGVSDSLASGAAEVAPLPGFSAERLDEAVASLDPIAIEPDRDPLALAFPSMPASARFALEAAWLDRRGRVERRSLASLLGASRTTLRSVVLIDSLETATSDAVAAMERGAPGVKLKIGRPGREDDEARALRDIRGVLGESGLIRVDANGALGGSMHPLLAVLREVGVEFVEEPFSVERLLGSPSLPVPVALDESVARAPALCLRAIESGLASVLVLKPSLHGISRTIELASETRARGGSVLVSHLYEGPRAFAALAHVALAVAPDAIHGLHPYPGIDRWSTDGGARVEPPSFLVGATMNLAGALGIG